MVQAFRHPTVQNDDCVINFDIRQAFDCLQFSRQPRSELTKVCHLGVCYHLEKALHIPKRTRHVNAGEESMNDIVDFCESRYSAGTFTAT